MLHKETLTGDYTDICKTFNCFLGWDSVVGIATGYGLDSLGIKSHWVVRFSAPVQTSPGAHPVSYTMYTRSFLGVKQLGCGAHNQSHLALR